MFEDLKNNFNNYASNIKKQSFNKLIETMYTYYRIFNNTLEGYLSNGDIEAFINLLKDEIKNNNNFEKSYAEIVQEKIRLKDDLKNQTESFTLGESSIKNILKKGIGSYKVDNLIQTSQILTDGMINGISAKTLYSLVPALDFEVIDINNITVKTYSNDVIFKSINDEIKVNKTPEELVQIGVISMRDAMELKRLDTTNYMNNIKDVYKDSKEDYRDIEDIELEEDHTYENYTNIINNIKNLNNNEEDYYEDNDYEYDEDEEDDDYY